FMLSNSPYQFDENIGYSFDEGFYSIVGEQYWELVSPVTFIDTLKKYRGEIIVVYAYPPDHWYNDEYIDQIHSKIKNMNIKNSATVMRAGTYWVIQSSGGFPIYKKSTLEEQALHIIDGIKDKKYPHPEWVKWDKYEIKYKKERRKAMRKKMRKKMIYR